MHRSIHRAYTRDATLTVRTLSASRELARFRRNYAAISALNAVPEISVSARFAQNYAGFVSELGRNPCVNRCGRLRRRNRQSVISLALFTPDAQNRGLACIPGRAKANLKSD